MTIPPTQVSVGDSWNVVSNNASGIKSSFQLYSVATNGRSKLFHIKYNLSSNLSESPNDQTTNETTGEIFLDFKSRIPFFTKTVSNLRKVSSKTSISLDTITTIKETSSNISKLELGAIIGEHIQSGTIEGSPIKNEPLEAKGVTN